MKSILDKTNDKANNIQNKIFDFVWNTTTNLLKDKFKSSFGLELILDNNEYGDSIDLSSSQKTELINRFVRKYDDNFDYHFNMIKENKESERFDHFVLKNSWCLIPIQDMVIPDTYIYIATGTKVYGDILTMFKLGINVHKDDIYFYIFGKKCKRIMNELLNTIEDIKNEKRKKDSLLFYFVTKRVRDNYDESKPNVITCSSIQKRDLSSLFYSYNEKDLITAHIDRFIDQKDFYKEKGLIHKTGILLYGEPGTGKSSLVNAIASKYERDIISIDVTNINDIDLMNVRESIDLDKKYQYIILLEDIDTLFLNRATEDADKEDRSIINKLLQFLDSNSSPNDVIFMATTNHIERLDAALIRDGRFDLKVEVKTLKREDLWNFCKYFELTKEDMNKLIIPANEGAECNQSMIQNKILDILGQKMKLSLNKV